MLGGRNRRDGSDDRAGTRREQETEAHAEQEAASDISRPSAPERLKRALDEAADRWDEERQAHQEHDPDRDVPEDVLREAERREQRRRGQREGGEADDEPGHDGERPPAAARSTAREDDRQNRKDARADRRDHAGDERDPDEQSHLGDRSRRF